MTLFRLCPRCGNLGEKSGLCPNCQMADDRRRNEKRRTSGRTSAAWNRLRAAAIQRDGFTCQSCGKIGTAGTLTVHLDPALGGDHWRATLDDLLTLCRSCHGSIDAPRAHATPAVRAEPSSVGISVG